MQDVASIRKELHETLAIAGEAYESYDEAKQSLTNVKAKKYEIVEKENGGKVFVPLEFLQSQIEDAEIESGRFITKITGRSTKEERRAELEAYMESIPEWESYQRILQSQKIEENIAQGVFGMAEKRVERYHTKVQALRNELEFLAMDAKIEAEKQHVEAERIRTGSDAYRAKIVETEQGIEEIRHETAKMLEHKSSMEYDTEQLRIGKEIGRVRIETATELKKYKEAVQPLLDFARSLQALQITEM